MKLVITDMDGTLLSSEKQLPSRFFPLLSALKERNVRFAIASGRQYYNLLHQFPGLETELIFIAENGGIVFEGDTCLFVSQMDGEELLAPVQAVRKTPGAETVLCGEKAAYVENTDPAFLNKVCASFARVEFLCDVMEAVTFDRICKLSVYHPVSAERYPYPVLQTFQNLFTVSLAGKFWVDLMGLGVNKGSAVRMLQKRMEIIPDDCIAFGDYLNDLELMDACTHSFAMANAHPGLKAVCRYEARSNDEDGVVEALVKHFGLTL